ncbi:hypothetical protein BC940DRAFT_294314 [Gongronella butleri]|nr:hypothetical protein BC940DRAFT_294314 [Gongronella butleri]
MSCDASPPRPTLAKRKKLLPFLSERSPSSSRSSSLPRRADSDGATRSTPSSVRSTSSSTATSCSTAAAPPTRRRRDMSASDIHTLRKLLTKFQTKIKHRHHLLKHQVLPWFHGQHECQDGGTPPRAMDPALEDQAVLILLRWWRTLILRVQHVNYTERSLYFECIVEIIARPEFLDYDYEHAADSYEDWYGVVEQQTLATRTCLEEYRFLLVTTLHYAMDRLNHKAIYSNMISFCAKILALCFVKVPSVANSLCQLLPVKAAMMRRVVAEMGANVNDLDQRQRLEKLFPVFLHPLMTTHLPSYKQHLSEQAPQQAALTLTGNWVRRWQSDDSELFFWFYRHYHVTMQSYLLQACTCGLSVAQRHGVLVCAPGYAYLAGYVGSKMQALLNMQLYSVTTIDSQTPATSNTTSSSSPPSSQSSSLSSIGSVSRRLLSLQNSLMPSHHASSQPLALVVSPALLASLPPMAIYSDADDTLVYSPIHVPEEPMATNPPFSPPPPPGMMGRTHGKPRALVLATQRYAECLVWCAWQAEPTMGLYHDMLNVFLRTMIKTTRLTAIESVYCLLDLVEAVVVECQQHHLRKRRQQNNGNRENQTNHASSSPLPTPDAPSGVPIDASVSSRGDWACLDLPFLLHTLRLILLQSDHTILLLRALAFIYQHFDIFDGMMGALTHDVLLLPLVFERLLLHWGHNVRLFYLRILVYRVGPLWPATTNIAWTALLYPRMMTHPNHGATSTTGAAATSLSSSSSTLSASSATSTASSSSMTLLSDHTAIATDLVQLCDGFLCWKTWQKELPMDPELRIALESHLHLEALLEAFQTRYLGMADDKVNNGEEEEKGKDEVKDDKRAMAALCSHIVCTSPVLSPNHSTSSSTASSSWRPHRVSLSRRLLQGSKWLKLFSAAPSVPMEASRAAPWLTSSSSSSSFSLASQGMPPNPVPGFAYVVKPAETDEFTSLGREWLCGARAWRYDAARHVYADKARAELKQVLHEHHQWSMGRKKDTNTDAPPLLALDWPKNWSFCQR